MRRFCRQHSSRLEKNESHDWIIGFKCDVGIFPHHLAHSPCLKRPPVISIVRLARGGFRGVRQHEALPASNPLLPKEFRRSHLDLGTDAIA